MTPFENIQSPITGASSGRVAVLSWNIRLVNDEVIFTYGHHMALLLKSHLEKHGANDFVLIVYENKTKPQECWHLMKNILETVLRRKIEGSWVGLGGDSYTRENVLWFASSGVIVSHEIRDVIDFAEIATAEFIQVQKQLALDHAAGVSDYNLRRNRACPYLPSESPSVEAWRGIAVFGVRIRGCVNVVNIGAIHAPGPGWQDYVDRVLGTGSAISVYLSTAIGLDLDILLGDFNVRDNINWEEAGFEQPFLGDEGSTYGNDGYTRGSTLWDRYLIRRGFDSCEVTGTLVDQVKENVDLQGASDHLILSCIITTPGPLPNGNHNLTEIDDEKADG